MAEQTPPAHQETVYLYEDKPNLATMLSGGVFLGAAVYFIVGLVLNSFEVDLILIQFGMAALPVLFSFRMGNTPTTTIQIDTHTGYIKAKNKLYSYEAYAHEPEVFMVLEKTSTANDRTYKDYKLTIKADDETTFDVPLTVSTAKKAILVVEEAKSAIPI